MQHGGAAAKLVQGAWRPTSDVVYLEIVAG
jgi:hypothetical protein